MHGFLNPLNYEHQFYFSDFFQVTKYIYIYIVVIVLNLCDKILSISRNPNWFNNTYPTKMLLIVIMEKNLILISFQNQAEIVSKHSPFTRFS